MFQVMGNFLGNAEKYSPSDTPIPIAAVFEQGCVSLRIVNTSLAHLSSSSTPSALPGIGETPTLATGQSGSRGPTTSYARCDGRRRDGPDGHEQAA